MTVLLLVGDDQLIEAGNIASSSAVATAPQLWGGDQSNDYQIRVEKHRVQWYMNYQEAAIYLEEGENNEKFDTHPKTQTALPAYLIGKSPSTQEGLNHCSSTGVLIHTLALMVYSLRYHCSQC